MARRIKNKQKFKFKAGDEYHLDQIYEVQGLCGADWWRGKERDGDDEVIITRDIEFEIIEYETIKKPK